VTVRLAGKWLCRLFTTPNRISKHETQCIRLRFVKTPTRAAIKLPYANNLDVRLMRTIWTCLLNANNLDS